MRVHLVPKQQVSSLDLAASRHFLHSEKRTTQHFLQIEKVIHTAEQQQFCNKCLTVDRLELDTFVHALIYVHCTMYVLLMRSTSATNTYLVDCVEK